MDEKQLEQDKAGEIPDEHHLCRRRTNTEGLEGMEALKLFGRQCGSLGMGKGASGAGKFARNIKTEAEFPNSQRNMLYRKRAFSGSCAAQQQTEKIRTEYKNGKTAMEEPPGCLLYFCCFFPFSLHFRKMLL